MAQFRRIVFETLRCHARIVRRNRAAMLCLCGTFAAVLATGIYRQTRHVVGYLLAVWLAAFITDVVVTIWPKATIGFPIKRSPVREALVIVGFTFVGIIPLAIRYSRMWPQQVGFERLVIFAGFFLFTFPTALAGVYVLMYRYKPSELGLNVHYWYLPLLIHFLLGVITLLAAPEKSHWHETLRAQGLWGLVYTGFVESALPEEFTRMLLQTRLSAVFRNNGLGFFTATFIWACIHIPVFWSQAPQLAFWKVVITTWQIIPIGLLWGYLMHRTKSFLPSVVLHGFNLWGLQNF